MNSLWVSLWVFGGFLAILLLMAAFGLFRRAEGFQGSTAGPTTSRDNAALFGIVRCPIGYTPFHSPAGDSLCCKGSINPYTHQCSARASDAICSMKPNVKDPRNPKSNLILCSTLMTSSMDSASRNVCPTSLPNYAMESETSAKCCKNPVVIKGEGFGCSSEDMRDPTKYCIVRGKGTLGTGEQYCDELAVRDGAECPTDSANRQVFQKVMYQFGKREADRYQIPSLTNVSIPVCFRLNETCIPEKAIKYAQTLGAYGEYSPATWEYSCENWKTRQTGQLANNTVRGYLTSGVSRPSSGPSSGPTASGPTAS